MVKPPIKVRSSANVLEAVKLILTHSVSGLCVVDEENKLIGMLSELDCLKAIIDLEKDKARSKPRFVYEAMTPDVVVNKPDNDIISVATSMLNEKHRRRPVVDQGVLIGQITCRQILGAISDFSIPAK
jgi:CBS domain-containing protein